MKVQVNGSAVDVKDGITVRELLKERQVKMPEMVSVEINDAIVEREAFETKVIHDGDRIEFLYFMGGGRGAL